MLFGGALDGGYRRAFDERDGVLQFAQSDVERVLRIFSGNANEREKLEIYRASIEGLLARQDQLRGRSDGIRSILQGRAEPGEAGESWASSPLHALAIQFDSATIALKAGLTDVVVLGSGTGGGFTLT